MLFFSSLVSDVSIAAAAAHRSVPVTLHGWGPRRWLRNATAYKANLAAVARVGKDGKDGTPHRRETMTDVNENVIRQTQADNASWVLDQ